MTECAFDAVLIGKTAPIAFAFAFTFIVAFDAVLIGKTAPYGAKKLQSRPVSLYSSNCKGKNMTLTDCVAP